MMINKTVSPA